MHDSSIPPAVSDPEWGLVRRILFRFGLLYFVLYALPFPFANLLRLVNGVHGWFRLEGEPPQWIVEGLKYLQYYTEYWQERTTWLGAKLSANGWVDLEVIHQHTGQGHGDTAHDLIKLGVSAILAALVTILWSLFDRRRSHHRGTGKWLHLGVRWYLAFVLLGYGIVKFYSPQFSDPSLQQLTNPIGDTSPMGLVWTFMGFSRPYEVCSGLGETLAGLLLFSRRTSLLGCFVAIPVMANVVLLNWMFDVPVKLHSTNLLLFAIALTVPDWARLRAVFCTNRPVPAADLRLARSRWLTTPLIILGSAWVAFHLYTAHTQNMDRTEHRAQSKPELYGVWEVEKMIRDGKEVAPDDLSRWKSLAIDVNDRAWVRTITDQTSWLHYGEDIPGKTIQVAVMGSTKPPPEKLEKWTFERSEVTRKGENPEPKKMADNSGLTDVKRTALVLKGQWQGKPIELHLLRKEFRLLRGFHLIQEIPYNR